MGAAGSKRAGYAGSGTNLLKARKFPSVIPGRGTTRIDNMMTQRDSYEDTNVYHPEGLLSHISDLVYAYGSEGRHSLQELTKAYKQTSDETAPVYVAPGRIDGIDAGLILPSKTKKDTVTHYVAIILTRLDPDNPATPLDHGLLRVHNFPSTADMHTPEGRITCLADHFRNWHAGLTEGFYASDSVGSDTHARTNAVPLSGNGIGARLVITQSAGVFGYVLDRETARLPSLATSFSTRSDCRHKGWARQYLVERRRLADAIVAFRRNLDPDITRFARDTGILTVNAYNLLAGHGDKEKARYRQQAVDAYPIFTFELTKQDDAVRYVDAGYPPADSLVASWKKKHPSALRSMDPDAEPRKLRDALRSLHRYTWRDTGKDPLQKLPRWTGWMRHIPKDWVPTDPTSFEAMGEIIKTAETAARSTKRDIIDLIRSTSGRWTEFQKKSPAEPAEGLDDMVDRAFNNLVLPALLRNTQDTSAHNHTAFQQLERFLNQDHQFRQRFYGSIFGDHGLLKILRANERFHRRLPRLDALAQAYANTGLAWPALSAGMEFKGLRIIPLTTPEALIDEGKAMKHCAGGYTEACLNGTHIVSVRDGDARLATAQIHEKFQDGTRQLLVSQIRGASNSPPLEDARKAVQSYVSSLNIPGNAPDFGQMDAEREVARTQGFRVHLRIGFDFTDPDAQDSIWQEWRNIIPGPARKAPTYDAFLTGTGLSDVIQRTVDQYLTVSPEHREDVDNPVSLGM